MTDLDWTVERWRGSAADFHERPVPADAGHSVWWFDVERPAVVVGSTQPLDLVDAEAAAQAGTEVVRRRSGGGAVHLVPGAVTWVDLILPATDPRWTDDVTRSFHWVGEAWAQVLQQLGHAEPVVHDGALVRSAWSHVACFAGLGPGEVTLAGKKVVGISQRRTRHGARFQCALIHRWDPIGLVDLLAIDEIDRLGVLFALTSGAAGIGDVPPAVVLDHLLTALREPPPA